MIVLLVASVIVELVLVCKPIWRHRRNFARLLLTLLILESVWLLLLEPFHIYVWIISIISFYRAVNIYRILKNRFSNEHLLYSFQNTSRKLILAQIIIGIIGIYLDTLRVSNDLWIFDALLGLLIAIAMTISIVPIKRSSSLINAEKLAVSKLPTLSVLIPARNESDSLNECLISLLACNYPKLEIIVLDDASSDRRTPEIIRSFAHDGVIFIPGKECPSKWLAKNWAYQQLLDSSNGELVLFCGADTKFNPSALTDLVSELMEHELMMLSLMPVNVYSTQVRYRILQPLRYSWEIALPRRLLWRPPVLSTCWLAKRSFLFGSGSFKAISRRISPESYFAGIAFRSHKYKFLRTLLVTSNKPVKDQLETSIRVRYPQLRRRPEIVALFTMLEIFNFFGLIPLSLVAGLDGNWILMSIGLVGIVFYFFTFGFVTSLTYRRFVFSGYFFWPLAVLVDIWLINVSMIKYEFGTVSWKGRNIDHSVMNPQADNVS